MFTTPAEAGAGALSAGIAAAAKVAMRQREMKIGRDFRMVFFPFVSWLVVRLTGGRVVVCGWFPHEDLRSILTASGGRSLHQHHLLPAGTEFKRTATVGNQLSRFNG